MTRTKKNSPNKTNDSPHPGNGHHALIEESDNQLVSPSREVYSRWEYVLVTFHDYKGWRPRYINGHELSDWMNNAVIHEYIEQMADDGWQLAAASSGARMYGSADIHQIYFKKPRD
jgi:hypothetical protein